MTDAIIHGDCLDVMKTIPDKSVDMVLADPPYGTTACKWDSIIPFEPLWKQLRRIIKSNGAIVMTAIQPFTSKLIISNLEMFKYCLVWKKSRVSHFAQAPYRFLTEHEDIVVFSYGGTSKNAKIRMVYNPQGIIDCDIISKGRGHSDHRPSTIMQKDFIQSKTNYPKSILEFKSDLANDHPTQKPVSLMEYLIRTYTNKGGLVLDFCIGSGTTAVACILTNRQYIGIESNERYIETAKKRIAETIYQPDFLEV